MSKLPNTLNPLDRRVLRQLKGNHDDVIATAKDAARHGADSGFGGFTYHVETVAFFKRNRKAILESLAALADDCGQTSSEMLAGFKCLEGITDPMAILANPSHDDHGTVANALAWFALEETGRKLLDADGEG